MGYVAQVTKSVYARTRLVVPVRSSPTDIVRLPRDTAVPVAGRRAVVVPVTLLLAACGVLTACGVPPELAEQSRATSPTRPTVSPAPSAGSIPPIPLPPTTAASTPAFAEYIAVDCQGRPDADAVIRMLRRTTDLLPDSLRIKVQVAPKCAGDWQYTVIEVAGREPLQVVTRGPAGDLDLVTAGTDVCNAAVRVAAPPGIRSIACESGPAPGATL
jgi:hypothetical protein